MAENECPYSAIVSDAKTGCLEDAIIERTAFRMESDTIESAIQHACLFLVPSANNIEKGVLHGHQRRVGYARLNQVAGLLIQSAKSIEKSKNFEELHNLVQRLIELPRIGPLTIYDISERLGWYLNISPENVYLHAGVIAGVKAIGLTPNSQTLPKSAFPASFQELAPMDIETLLCVYKMDLAHPEKFQSGRSCQTVKRSHC